MGKYDFIKTIVYFLPLQLDINYYCLLFPIICSKFTFHNQDLNLQITSNESD